MKFASLCLASNWLSKSRSTCPSLHFEISYISVASISTAKVGGIKVGTNSEREDSSNTDGNIRKKLYIFDGTALLYTSYFSKECVVLNRGKCKSLSNEATTYFHKLIKDRSVKPSSPSLVHNNSTSQQLKEDQRLTEISATTNNKKNDDINGHADHDMNRQSSNALHIMSLNFLRFIQEHKPSHAVVAFDHQKRNFRHSLFPDYKQNRSSTPDGLLYQLLAAPLVFNSLGVRCFRMDNYEADDVMASVGRLACDDLNMDVVYVSSDKDMYQLVTSPSVKIIQPMTRRVVSFDNLKDIAGVPARQFCDFQALSGDAADNIPGMT